MDPRQAFTQSSNSGQSNLQAHMALNSFTDQKNAENDQAAMQEAAYYERLNQEAEEMLAPDRKRFDDMVGKMQGSIRSKIAMYGGDRKEFLRSGGHKIMQNFSTEVTKSKEYETYIQNKQNYVKVKDAMEKGLGHLVSIRDKKALENYEASGDGKITFSGIMSELEIPSTDNYNLGQDIPIADILYNKDNYMKVLGNYMMNFPEDKNPTAEKLAGFVNIMGYGKNKGSNRELLRMQQKLALEKATAAIKDPKVTKDTRPQLFTTNLLKMQDYIPKGTKIKDLFETEAGSYLPKGKLKNMSKTDTFLSSNLEGDWKNDSYVVNEDDKGFDWVRDSPVLGFMAKNFGDRWQPIEANEIAPNHKQTIAEHFLSIAPNESGEYKLDPSEIGDMYSSKGVELVGDNNLEPGEYDTNYKNLGIITGIIGKTKDGNNQMIMNITDGDGETVAQKQKDHVNALTDGEAKMGYFIALKNVDNDRIYYKKINMEDTQALRALSVKIGSADDLKNQNESSQRLEGQFNEAESQVKKEEANFDQTLLTIDTKVQNSGNFQQEAEMYANPDDNTQNRSSLMKSFYAITGLDTEGQKFHSFMEMFPESSKLMRTYGHNTTDEELIDILVTEMNNQSDTDEEKSDNKQTGKTWKNAYKRYLELNKQ